MFFLTEKSGLSPIVHACATELLQLFVEGRGALPLDVVIDMAGGATGMLGWGIVKRST